VKSAPHAPEVSNAPRLDCPDANYNIVICIKKCNWLENGVFDWLRYSIEFILLYYI
jgi:hypothetical protein